jgi:riboflavin synthase
MFTGIIEETGTIDQIRKGNLSVTLTIAARKILSDIKVGDSINTNGICLSVTYFEDKIFTVDAVAETIRKTNLNALKPGSRVNLERALKLSDRLGGHMVSGHIDGTGTIQDISKEGKAWVYTIAAHEDMMRYIIKKGSVAVDGISLTVADLDARSFTLSIIPLTFSETTLIDKKKGDVVNIECDIFGKYVEKFAQQKNQKSGLTMDYLTEHGFTD